MLIPFMRKSNFYFRFFFLLSCGNFIKFVVALKFFRSQLSKREGKKDAMQQQQQQREKKTVHLYPHNTHILYTDEEPPQNKKRGNRNNKQNTRKYRSARYHTIQYMRHLNKHCCLENLGESRCGQIKNEAFNSFFYCESINRHKEEPFMQFQVRIKPIFTNSGVKILSIHHHQYWFCSGLGFWCDNRNCRLFFPIFHLDYLLIVLVSAFK